LILGIGTDLADVRRVQQVWQRHPERFPLRLLAASEQLDFSRSPQPARFLARRLAAKEALAKALGTGLATGVRLRDIAVTHAPTGAPILLLGGVAALQLARHGSTRLHLSLSDDGDYALAYVLIEQSSPQPQPGQ
jgi:holo-[acyl-carrier protein] synthase